MIYITQLIFIKKGKEVIFHEFESLAIPLLEKYTGKILYRIRPSPESFVSALGELPYEVHFISFDSENDLSAFLKDKTRLAFMHLKEKSIKSILLIKGQEM